MSVRFSLNHTDDSAVESGDNQQRTNQGTLNAWQWCLLLAFCKLSTCTCIQGRMCLHVHPLLTIHFLFPPTRPKHPPKVHIWAGISSLSCQLFVVLCSVVFFIFRFSCVLCSPPQFCVLRSPLGCVLPRSAFFFNQSTCEKYENISYYVA